MAASVRAWVTLGLLSALFFVITAATFDSLGLVLPAMVSELGWGWTEAGLGFTLLGVFCGITATVPAWLIRHLGVRACLLIGSAVMAAAFLCLAGAHGLPLYLLGTSLAGLGFALLDTVPGTYLLSRLFPRPAFAFGIYFTIGGLGAIFSPLLYYLVTGTGHWRTYWFVVGAVVVATGLVTALLTDSRTDVAAGREEDPAISRQDWSARAALRTPQFWILAAAYSAFLFCGITANSVSVAHLTQHGVAAALAGTMIAVSGAVNAGARLAGGLLTRIIDARLLLAGALLLLVVGLVALSAAQGGPLVMIYALGIGIGYGLTFLASTILLLDYFGRGPYLELFSLVNLISTTGAVAPFLAGLSRDRLGSFTPFFLALAVLVGVVALAVVVMRPPQPGTRAA